MKCPVMDTAERHRKLITHLEPQSTRLGKTQMMRIGRTPPTDQAGLRGDQRPVILVASAARLAKGEGGTILVRDGRRSYVSLSDGGGCRLGLHRTGLTRFGRRDFRPDGLRVRRCG